MAVIAFNDAYVMSAWGKANGIKEDEIVSFLFLSFLLLLFFGRESLFSHSGVGIGHDGRIGRCFEAGFGYSGGEVLLC